MAGAAPGRDSSRNFPNADGPWPCQLTRRSSNNGESIVRTLAIFAAGLAVSSCATELNTTMVGFDPAFRCDISTHVCKTAINEVHADGCFASRKTHYEYQRPPNIVFVAGSDRGHEIEAGGASTE